MRFCVTLLVTAILSSCSWGDDACRGGACHSVVVPPITILRQPLPPPPCHGKPLKQSLVKLFQIQQTPPLVHGAPPPAKCTTFYVALPSVAVFCLPAPNVATFEVTHRAPCCDAMPPANPCTLLHCRPSAAKHVPAWVAPPITILVPAVCDYCGK